MQHLRAVVTMGSLCALLLLQAASLLEGAVQRPKKSTDLNEAEQVLRRALDLNEQTLGPNHPRLVPTLDRLGVIVMKQGRYHEAETLFRRGLIINEKVRGPDHPEVSVSLNNLGVLYTAEGRYQEAESLFHRSLRILEQAMGPDRMEVAASLENYATLLRKLHRDVEAEGLESRAHDIQAKHRKGARRNLAD